MKKIIFILVAMLFITSCSSDRSNDTNTGSLNPEFYQEKPVNLASFTGIPQGSTVYGDYSVFTKNYDDLYVRVSKDNSVALKLFDNTYKGNISSYNTNSFNFIDNTSKKTIYIEKHQNGYYVEGIKELSIKDNPKNKYYSVNSRISLSNN
ncbi:TPA: membrane lipoprotein lipid attachment site-containing protein [Elizabethkingia anophelis]